MLLTIFGVHEPVMAAGVFIEDVGKVGAVEPKQIGAGVLNNVVTLLFTVTFKVVGTAHWPAFGVNV